MLLEKLAPWLFVFLAALAMDQYLSVKSDVFAGLFL